MYSSSEFYFYYHKTSLSFMNSMIFCKINCRNLKLFYKVSKVSWHVFDWNIVLYLTMPHCVAQLQNWSHKDWIHLLLSDSIFVLPFKAKQKKSIDHHYFIVNGYFGCFWETGSFFLTAATHTSSLLLKLCRFLSVCYSPLHKAHWLVHVAFNPVNHPTLTWGIVSEMPKGNKINKINKNDSERERAGNKSTQNSTVVCDWKRVCGVRECDLFARPAV